MSEPDAEFRSDRQITTDFLSYLQSDSAEHLVYEIEPTPLVGGCDARLYRYKLVGQEPRVLRILRPARIAEELLRHQCVHQILKRHGLNAPLIHRVCADQSVLGGVFAVMDLLPGETLFKQAPDVHATVLGESMAAMHAIDVGPVVNELRRAGVPDNNFLLHTFLKSVLDLGEKSNPWASELIAWLCDHLPLAGHDLSVIHGDYHGGNLMFEKGSLTGVLDWSFVIADPAVDLANMMNDYLLFARQAAKDISSEFCEQIVEGAVQAYQSIRSLDYERIKVFRVLHLLGPLCNAAVYPEFMRKPESQRDYLTFIEQTAGLKLSITV